VSARPLCFRQLCRYRLVVSEKFLIASYGDSRANPKRLRKINQVAYLVPRHLTKAKALLPILELENPESVFVRTRRTAAELTNILQAAGHSADEYHGDLTNKHERLLMRFRNKQVGNCHGYCSAGFRCRSVDSCDQLRLAR